LKLFNEFWDESFNVLKKYIGETGIPVLFFPRKDEIPDEDCLIINPQENIHYTADKFEMNELFLKLQIPHPRTFLHPLKDMSWYHKWYIRRFPKTYISKPRRGYGGNGKKIHESYPKIYRDEQFVQEFYEHAHHIRLYWLDNKVVCWCEFVGGKGLIRNAQYGWRYTPINIRAYMRPMCQAAIMYKCGEFQEATGLNFFGVDIAFNSEDDWKFLEINSMPAVRGHDWRIIIVGDAIKKWIEQTLNT
jgi:glutathione synthase/RimK-type ligase-like ATP-grasp enzyme